MKRDENLILKTSSDNFIKYMFYIAFYILIFICLVSVYYYLTFNNYVKKINVIDKENLLIENFINSGESRRAIDYYSKMTVVQDILKSRVFLRNIFDMIEKNTHYEIVFNEFEVVNNGEVWISGNCSTEEVCAQAVLLFEKMEECEVVKLESIDRVGSGNFFKLFLKINNF
jgi:hypothetical protein